MLSLARLKSAILALEDGTVYEGISIGAEGVISGEVVFNTSMTGYQEIMTDPSYKGQIISFNYPHIGNTGINLCDNESDRIHASGVVVNHMNEYYSHWNAKTGFYNFLKDNHIIGIAEIDTRSLTKRLRQHGSLKGCIQSKKICVESAIQQAVSSSGTLGQNLTEGLERTKTCSDHDRVNTYIHCVVVDLGVKLSILHELKKCGGRITIVSACIDFQTLVDMKPDLVVLSNGPGDPSAVTEVITLVKYLIQTEIPILGICLGCQILGLALGAQTQKMKYGHHGANHPIIDMNTNQVYITSQNHNFAISDKNLPSLIEVTHRSLFDGSIQGIKHKEKLIWGYQGHPESGPGPWECKHYFSKFFKAVENNTLSKSCDTLELVNA